MCRTIIAGFSCFSILSAVLAVSASELKIDFQNSGRSLSEGLDPAYTPWSTNQTWLATGANAISNTFGGVLIRFRRVDTFGTTLKSGYWKEGITTAAYNAKLVNDGILADSDNGGNSGAQIEMLIRGLSAGPHTLQTYHNTFPNPASYTFSPLNILVNGVQVVTNLPVSNRVTNNADAAYSYLQFTAVAGQDVVVLFKADTSNASITDKNVYINGFEIDTPYAANQASRPYPLDREGHANADGGSLVLAWNAASNAISHDVYFGTDSNAVKTATHASPEYKGNQTGTNYSASGLSSLATYWWRIDEVDGSGFVTTGNLWNFRPRHLAFPGAEGYGRFARGGRGGIVVEVTNTNDSGPGSLRAALENNSLGPRTVVFTVSGLITLNSNLTINGEFITLAGQTAPGKGICTRGWTFGMSGGDDVIIRHIRSRPGNISSNTINGSGMASSDHCIMDHCSISWGIDEEMSTRNSQNVTLQRVLISEALNIAGHDHYEPGYPHGFAATIGGDTGSFHHNLLAHCQGRNWSMAGGLDGGGYFAGRLDIRNNVVYNWRSYATEGGAHEVNFVNNYYKPGAATTNFFFLVAQYGNFPGTQQYYVVGNVMPGYYDETTQTNGRVATTENGGSVPTNYSPWVEAPFFPSYVDTESAGDSYKRVLSDVGCTQPMIDDHDVRVINETLTGTYTYTGTGPYGGFPGLPNSQDDVGGWEVYPNETRPANFDTDHDGLPDWWERMKGLNTNSPSGDFSDANADLVGDEYTELERYLNWLAGLHVDGTNNIPLEIDLSRFTRGFTNNPVHAVSGPVSGTVMLLGDGQTARFTPNGGEETLGSFTFTVTDAEGSSMTNEVGVYIVPGLAGENTAPVFDGVADETVNVGVTVIVTNTATDSDIPAQTLTYSLLAAPTGAILDTNTGVFTWRPTAGFSDTTNSIAVMVTDSGSPNLTATQNFNVTVNMLTPPTVSAAGWNNGVFNLTFDGQTGPDYAVETSTNLVDWSTLLITNSPFMPITIVDPNATDPVRFYRLKVGPPLP